MLLRLLIAAPFLLLLVLFALSNTGLEQLHLWPTDYVLVLPLSVAILAAMGIGFLLGALFLWFALVGARARARAAQRDLLAATRHERELEIKLEELQARLSAMSMARAASPGAQSGAQSGALALTR